MERDTSRDRLIVFLFMISVAEIIILFTVAVFGPATKTAVAFEIAVLVKATIFALVGIAIFITTLRSR